MTNEQTSVMLRGIAEQLRSALEYAEDKLPIEAFEVMKNTFYMGLPNQNEFITICPALAQLEKVLDYIETSSDLLIKEDTNG